MKKIALLSGISAAVDLAFLASTAQAVAVSVNAGSNLVSVHSCTQTGADIKIRRSSTDSEYTLISACRNAGHGLRDYKMTCTSNKQYRVEWKDCGTTPAPTPTPQVDNQGPVVSVNTNVMSGTITNNQYSYQVNVSAQDAGSNIRGILVTVRNQATGATVQSWWVENKNGLSDTETGFGTNNVTKSVGKTGLQVGTYYTVSARAYDTRGNSTVANAPVRLYVASTGDTVRPSVTANVTYAAVWYPGNNAQKVIPTLSARATDTNKVTKVVLYYNSTQLGQGYSVLKTCNTNSLVVSCTHPYEDPTHGNFFAVAYDEAGNSATSTKFAF